MTGFIIIFIILIARLFYWQILNNQRLSAAAASQQWSEYKIPAPRGEIYTQDEFALVANKPAYNLFLDKKNTDGNERLIFNGVLSMALEEDDQASAEARLEPLISDPDVWWVKLFSNLSEERMLAIENEAYEGLVWQKVTIRDYPEASAAAHLTGFVAANSAGYPQGYFGLEGFYNRELTGREGKEVLETDAIGNPIVSGRQIAQESQPGRTLVTHIDRTVQFLAKRLLKEGIERYEALSGTVTIMDPKTGAVLAMAALPDYFPGEFAYYANEFYPNPIVSQSYEPGSTFKVLVMAAAINEGLVDNETVCPCRGPAYISGFSIETWDGVYHPNSSIEDIVKHSDNVGMVYTAQLFEPDMLVDYVKKFGFGELTGVDLQEEASPALRDLWREIDLATVSFGQGIAVTPLQMVNAVGALANRGVLMEPQVVDKIRIQNAGVQDPEKSDVSGQMSDVDIVDIEPHKIRQVVSEMAAKKMTDIMVTAVKEGEAKWTAAKGYKIAGKTGTAQIPVAGNYDAEKTITSFVGFAPADDPRFVMLVTLREPQTSQWGSETAAPLWFEIARQLFLHYGIAPNE